MDLDDEPNLWTRARAGDDAARRSLVELTREIAVRELRARRAPAKELEDLVQETVRSTLACLTAGTAEPREVRAFLKFRSWGVLSDHWKRTRRHPMETRSNQDLDGPSGGQAPHAAVAQGQVVNALSDCRARLGAEQRLVLELRYDEHLDTDEIVARTGANRSTVHVRVFRALQSLRECMARKGFDAGDLQT